MDKLEMRARARAAARASGLFDMADDARHESGKSEQRGRSSPRTRAVAPPSIDAIDEAQARAACKPMGELETIVQAADATGRVRTLYVIVPDLALKLHYQRLGFEIEAGCHVLLDADEMLPIAVLRLSVRNGAGTPPRRASTAGFNPYFEVQST